MSATRQNTQLDLAFSPAPAREAGRFGGQGTEALTANRNTESPACDNRLMEAICEPENIREAVKRVRANKGSPGIDGMTVESLARYLRAHWVRIEQQLLV